MTPTEQYPDLLPCPFCGEKPQSRLGYPNMNWVSCYPCVLGRGSSTAYYDKSEDAIKAWNTRTPDAALLSELSSLDAKYTNAVRSEAGLGIKLEQVQAALGIEYDEQGEPNSYDNILPALEAELSKTRSASPKEVDGEECRREFEKWYLEKNGHNFEKEWLLQYDKFGWYARGAWQAWQAALKQGESSNGK